MKISRKDKGQATVIVIGGASEALNYSSDSIELYLKRRMGFIKLALRFGRDLVIFKAECV